MSNREPTQIDEPAEPQAVDAPSEATASPRADLHDSIGWIILGVAVVIASFQMDRLTDRHINPLTVPGLVPGLLGIGMVIVGTIFGVRSWLRGARREPARERDANQRQRGRRVLLAVILCCGYSMVLIGHGLPFWLASSIYVTISILVFNRISSDPAKRRTDLAAVVKTLLIGTICSVAIWLVFERLFLVRLP